jgi:hypothetical protein
MIGTWYIFGAWLMHSLMVQVEVQGWCMVDALVYGTVDYRFLVQVGAWLMHLFMVEVDWYRFTTVYLTVIV